MAAPQGNKSSIPLGGTNNEGGYAGREPLPQLYEESGQGHSREPFPVAPAFGKEEGKGNPPNPHEKPFVSGSTEGE